jgi:hypothetical protein
MQLEADEPEEPEKSELESLPMSTAYIDYVSGAPSDFARRSSDVGTKTKIQ